MNNGGNDSFEKVQLNINQQKEFCKAFDLFLKIFEIVNIIFDFTREDVDNFSCLTNQQSQSDLWWLHTPLRLILFFIC